MYKQGASLGRQIASFAKDAIVQTLESARLSGTRVWFLGRDCYAIYMAVTAQGYSDVARYLKGLNRENTRNMSNDGTLSSYMHELGVRPNDTLVDSGFRGSIFKAIQREDLHDLVPYRKSFYACVARKCVQSGTHIPDGTKNTYHPMPAGWYVLRNNYGTIDWNTPVINLGNLINFLLISGESHCEFAVISKDEKHRHMVLAMEHSPKREIVTWDRKIQRPSVRLVRPGDRDKKISIEGSDGVSREVALDLQKADKWVNGFVSGWLQN